MPVQLHIVAKAVKFVTAIENFNVNQSTRKADFIKLIAEDGQNLSNDFLEIFKAMYLKHKLYLV